MKLLKLKTVLGNQCIVIKNIKFIKMKKPLILFLFASILILTVSYCSFNSDDLTYTTHWRDTFRAFGDGRFQVLSGVTYDLFDQGCDIEFPVVYDIEKYIEEDNHVYLIGYYSMQGGPSLSHVNIETCEIEEFDDYDKIPKYLVLDYNNAELHTYISLEDIPESKKVVFEKQTNWWCKLQKTCYEKN